MTATTTSTEPTTPVAGGAPHRRPLPPGQWRLDWFPRFGTNLDKPPPMVPADPVVEIGGAVTEPFAVAVADLATMPRRRLDADLHCVSGWTASDLHWDGVAFVDFYRLRIKPTLRPGAVVTHLEFRGLDGFRSVVLLEDALDQDVLLADHLDGEPLNADHGAPLRLISPAQYGYISTKHLCRIDVHTAKPTRGPRSFVLDVLLHSHPRARVWEEERHGAVPGHVIRPIYRIVAKLMLHRSRRSSTDHSNAR
jgi:DMSO/TMAO reductase YedYZ molybdopterin-dependent catalytic subunit